jgi:hypothetical protein
MRSKWTGLRTSQTSILLENYPDMKPFGFTSLYRNVGSIRSATLSSLSRGRTVMLGSSKLLEAVQLQIAKSIHRLFYASFFSSGYRA